MDREKLQGLLEKARGTDRTYRQYALKAGVSPSIFSKFEKSGYKPSPTILKRLTSEEAEPRGNVTYEDLMIAAGYVDEHAFDILVTDENNETVLIEAHSKISDAEKRERAYTIRMYELLVTGMLFQEISAKGWEAKMRKQDRANDKADMFIELENQPIKRWQFEIMPNQNEMEKAHNKASMRTYTIRHHLSKYFFAAPDPDCKLTMVVNDIAMYEDFMRLKGNLLYRGELSVLLLSSDGTKVIQEEYISNYEPDDHSREIFIQPVMQ